MIKQFLNNAEKKRKHKLRKRLEKKLMTAQTQSERDEIIKLILIVDSHMKTEVKI